MISGHRDYSTKSCPGDYAYPLLLRPHGPTLALYVDEPTLAAQIMIRKGFKLIGESDLKD